MNITLKQVRCCALCANATLVRRGTDEYFPACLIRSIKELEDRLGAQLVERQSRDVVPTFGRMIPDIAIPFKTTCALEEPRVGSRVAGHWPWD